MRMVVLSWCNSRPRVPRRGVALPREVGDVKIPKKWTRSSLQGTSPGLKGTRYVGKEGHGTLPMGEWVWHYFV